MKLIIKIIWGGEQYSFVIREVSSSWKLQLYCFRFVPVILDNLVSFNHTLSLPLEGPYTIFARSDPVLV